MKMKDLEKLSPLELLNLTRRALYVLVQHKGVFELGDSIDIRKAYEAIAQIQDYGYRNIATIEE